MDREFVNKVLGQVRKRMRTFEVPGYRQSRRVEGMFDRDDEIHGFKNLCVYIDTALAGKEETVSEILGHVDKYLYSKGHYNHTRWLMFFGSDHNRLVAPGPSRVHQAIRASSWMGSITRCIACNPANGNALIPRLHNPSSINTHFPDRDDLALFFCKGKEIYSTDEQNKNITAIRQRSLWFFFCDDKLPEMVAGTLVSLHIM